jgi:hypothetical protein
MREEESEREREREREGGGCPVAVSESIAINNRRDYTLLRLRCGGPVSVVAVAADRDVAARDVANEGGAADRATVS